MEDPEKAEGTSAIVPAKRPRMKRHVYPKKGAKRGRKPGTTPAMLTKIQGIVELECYEGKTLKEACQVLGYNYNSTKTILSREKNKKIIHKISIRLLGELEREKTKIVSAARYRIMRKMAQLSDSANERIGDILQENGADAKTQIIAAKHVHNVMGVTETPSQGKPTSFFSEEDKERFRTVIDTLGVVMDSKVIDSTADVIDAEFGEV